MPKKKSKLDTGSKIAVTISNAIMRFLLDAAIYAIVIFAAISLCKYSYSFCYRMFGDASVDKEEEAFSMNITVYEGETTMQIAERLEAYGLILDKYSFVVKTKLDSRAIRAGTFTLNSGMDYSEILEVIGDYRANIEKEKAEMLQDDLN